jgi:hypothetical protein
MVADEVHFTIGDKPIALDDMLELLDYMADMSPEDRALLEWNEESGSFRKRRAVKKVKFASTSVSSSSSRGSAAPSQSLDDDSDVPDLEPETDTDESPVVRRPSTESSRKKAAKRRRSAASDTEDEDAFE